MARSPYAGIVQRVLTVRDLNQKQEKEDAPTIVGTMWMDMTSLTETLNEQDAKSDAAKTADVANSVLASLYREVNTGLDQVAAEAKIDRGTISVASDEKDAVQGVLLRRWGAGRRSLIIVWLTTSASNLDPTNASPQRGVGWALVQPMIRDADAARIPILVSPEGQKARLSYIRYGFVPIPGRDKELMRPSPGVAAAIARRPQDAPALLAIEYGYSQGTRTLQQRDAAVVESRDRPIFVGLGDVLGRAQPDPNQAFYANAGAGFASRFGR